MRYETGMVVPGYHRSMARPFRALRCAVFGHSEHMPVVQPMLACDDRNVRVKYCNRCGLVVAVTQVGG